MKALTKKVLVTVIAIIITATLAFAGMNNNDKVSWDEVYNHPALDQIATACKASF